VISDIEGSLKIIANIVVSSENTQVCYPVMENELCWEYDSEYDFVRGDNPRYYDIRVTTSGTKVVDGELVRVDESYLLVFDGNSYK